MGGITGEKAALRKELLARRNSLPDREEKSRAIRRAVLALEAWGAADAILLYLSAGSEPDTWDLLDQAWKQGKAVCAPRCLDGQGRMAFYRMPSPEALVPGRFGLWEPDPARCAPVGEISRGLCLVPGIAFDRAGYRLGYGKGYYDRFLAAHPVETVGLCFGELVLPSLPRELTDRPVGRLVTEAGEQAASQDRRPGKEGCV